MRHISVAAVLLALFSGAFHFGGVAWPLAAFVASIFVFSVYRGLNHISYYLLPSVPYLFLPAGVLLLSDRGYAVHVGLMLLLAVWSIFAGFWLSKFIFGFNRAGLNIVQGVSPLSAGFLWVWLIFFQVVLNFLTLLQGVSAVFLAISLVAKQLIFFLGAVALVFLGRRSLAQALLFLLLCLVYFYIRDLGRDEVSRFQYAQVLYSAVLLFILRGVLPVWGMALFVFLGAVAVIGFFLMNPFAGGGDALILLHVEDVVREIYSGASIEPLMFFHNMGLIYLPDALWPSGERPTLYNPSAWYLSEVMGIDPSSYPWGVGLAGVGAAFLQGGWLGVVLIYISAGLLFGYFYNAFSGLVRVGAILYLSAPLSFALFRMDASFLVGPAFITLPVIIIVARYLAWLEGGRFNRVQNEAVAVQ